MGEDKIELFRRKLGELKTGKFAIKIRQEKDRLLVSLILSFNEEEVEKCLHEYLNTVNLTGDPEFDSFLSPLLKRRVETIADLDEMKAFRDEVTADTPLGQKLNQFKSSSDPNNQALKGRITIEIDKAIKEIENNPGKRSPVAKTTSSKNMLSTLKTCYLKEKGQPRNLQELMNFEPTSGPPTCEPPIPKAYLDLFEKWGNASSEKEIRQALEEHRKYVSIKHYPYFRTLRYLRWAIQKRGDKDIKREIDIEIYLQIVSQLLADSGKLQTSQQPFDDEEKQFFFGPLRTYTPFYQDFVTRFEVLFKEGGAFTENFDSVGVIHLLLLLEAKRRKVELLPGQEFSKIVKAIKKFKEEVEKKKDAQVTSKTTAQSEPQKFFIDSQYAAAQGYYKVGQVISSSVGVFTIIGVREHNRVIFVEFNGIPDVLFSMSYNTFRDRAWEQVPILVAESFKQFVGAISEIALKALGYSISFFTGGLSALVIDVGWDYALQYGVESGVISGKTGFVLSLAIPVAPALAARATSAAKGVVSKVARGLEGTTNVLSGEARAIGGGTEFLSRQRSILNPIINESEAVGASLLSRQRAAAVRRSAAKSEQEAAKLESRAALETPDRARRMQERAAKLREEAHQLRSEAEEYASGSRSPTWDFPEPDEVAAALDRATSPSLANSGPIKIPLSAIERSTANIPRLSRALIRGEKGRVVFRVEGGGSRNLVKISAKGNATVAENTVYLNFGSIDRAMEFLAKRGPGSRIVTFEVDEAWIKSLRSSAIPETGTSVVRNTPRLVDIRFAEDQLEIPASLVPELNDFIIPGTGRVIVVQ